MMQFTIPGPAVAKQRARRAPAGHWYTPEKTVAYESQVAWEAQAAGVKLESDRAYGIEVLVYVSRWRSDLDNVFKAIADGLNQLPGFDDRQITSLRVEQKGVRDGGEERVEVTLEDRGPRRKESDERQEASTGTQGSARPRGRRPTRQP